MSVVNLCYADAVVVDVGTNRFDGKLCGDFKEDLNFYDGNLEMPSTPVPGGVGLLTRLALLKNCKDLIEEYEICETKF